MRIKEIDRLVAHVQRRETVRVVAGHQFGRTTLLRQLGAALTAQGFTVIHVAGDPALTSFKYAALRDQLISSERLAQCSTPQEVRGEAQAALTRTTNTALLVDDAEHLDAATAEALAPLFAQQQIVGVLVTAPFDHLTPSQRSVAHAIRANARLELGSLSFEQTGVLSQELLRGPVSPTLSSEVFALSSGIAGIAADTIRSARASETIQFQSDRWVMVGTHLWNEHLHETVERLLAPLSQGPLRLIHALALAGNLPINQLQSLDSEGTTALTKLGLLTTFVDPHGAPQVAPRPALITDYFRNRPLDMVSAEALTILDQAAKAGTINARKAEYELSTHALHSDTELTHNAGLTRYLRDRNRRNLREASQTWRTHASPENAVRYLEALLSSPDYPAAAPEVLSRTPAVPTSEITLLQLALHEIGLASTFSPISTPFGEMLREQAPEHARCLKAFGVFLLFSELGLTEEVQAWLEVDETDPLGFSDTIRAYIRACTGNEVSEGDARVRSGMLPSQHIIAEQTELIAKLWRDWHPPTGERQVLLPQNATPALEPYASLTSSYIRAHAEASLGHHTAALKTLSHTLSIGGLDLRYAPLYAAALRWSAYLHFYDGRSDIARSLLDESRGYEAATGPLPGMRPAFGRCLEALFVGDATLASSRLLQEATTCFRLSFVDAAWAMAKLAFEVAPSLRALDLLESLGVHPLYTGAPHIAAFARAALSQDPALGSLTSYISEQSDLAAAAGFLDAVERHHREAGVRPSAEYVRAVSEARHKFEAVRAPLDRRLSPTHASDVELLTPRELEVAPLTATLTNRDIAERLTLSVRTVENHVARAMKKLGLSSRADLSAAVSGGGSAPRLPNPGLSAHTTNGLPSRL